MDKGDDALTKCLNENRRIKAKERISGDLMMH
jgi:hypothetical protein